MPHLLTQTEFDTAAAAWLAFIGRASAGEVQALFQTRPAHKHEHEHPHEYQTYVRFDLDTTIPYLLSTVGIARVAARFVLVTPPADIVPAPPRFRVVLYATDQLGGRISAYYLGDSEYNTIPKPTRKAKPGLTLPNPEPDADPAQGLVPFSLISNWLTAWVTAATHQHLSPTMFATSSYGPLQGYVFEMDDFMDQLFSAPERGSTLLYLNFGLKTYFPAHPEKPAKPAQTFGLVVRLYSQTVPPPPPPPKADDRSAAIEVEQRNVADLFLGAAAYVSGTGGSESGPSYDMAQPYPPG